MCRFSVTLKEKKNKGLLQADSTQKKKKFDISFTDIKGTESALS